MLNSEGVKITKNIREILVMILLNLGIVCFFISLKGLLMLKNCIRVKITRAKRRAPAYIYLHEIIYSPIIMLTINITQQQPRNMNPVTCKIGEFLCSLIHEAMTSQAHQKVVPRRPPVNNSLKIV